MGSLKSARISVAAGVIRMESLNFISENKNISNWDIQVERRVSYEVVTIENGQHDSNICSERLAARKCK